MKKIMIPVVGLLAVAAFAGVNSGLKPGESVTPFHPTHIVGPLAGTTNCFPCTFQARPQVQVWVNGDDAKNVVTVAKTLDAQMAAKSKQEFKALIVLLADGSNKASLAAMAKNVAKTEGLKHVDVAVLDKKDEAVSNYKINLDKSVKNTVFVYKNWKVEDKMVNFVADANGVKSLTAAINRITG